MKTLDLYKVWEIMQYLSLKQSELSEKDIFVSFLRNSSNYSDMSFEGFLVYYYFKIEEDLVIVFNDDAVQWEAYNNNDFSYLPKCLLNFDKKELEQWVTNAIKSQLKQREESKIEDKKRIELQIKMLQKQLNN